MSRYSNSRKEKFINSLPKNEISNSGLSSRSKLNFSFFDGSQPAGQDYRDLSQEDLVKIFEKIKNYSKENLLFWRNERCGAGGLKVFTEYGDFPKKSEFTHPPHVPHDVMWARFRVESKFRLIGFLVPDRLHEKMDEETKCIYDRNTFYVVFLDKDHLFYKTQKENN